MESQRWNSALGDFGLRLLQDICVRCRIHRLSKMAVNDDFVRVRKSLFDHLRQHCEHCPNFSEQLQDSCSKTSWNIKEAGKQFFTEQD